MVFGAGSLVFTGLQIGAEIASGPFRAIIPSAKAASGHGPDALHTPEPERQESHVSRATRMRSVKFAPPHPKRRISRLRARDRK